jgi:hypothetical protein
MKPKPEEFQQTGITRKNPEKPGKTRKNPEKPGKASPDRLNVRRPDLSIAGNQRPSRVTKGNPIARAVAAMIRSGISGTSSRGIFRR